MQVSELSAGATYTFEQVAKAFEMKPAVLTWQGGIISRPRQQSLLLITKAELESIDYHDRWHGPDLVYGARGQRGDQEMTSSNRLLSANARTNHVFEALGRASMRYLGIARAARWWWAEGPDADGKMRKVIRFLMVFGATHEEEIILPIDEQEYQKGTEGSRRIVQHTTIERNRAIVYDAKRLWMRTNPDLRCEVCDMSFEAVYGERGKSFIEAHHRIPLSELRAETETRITDLAAVCANCHRMLHVGTGCTVEQLRASLRR